MAIDQLKKFALRWGPALLMMGLIFLFSSIPMEPKPLPVGLDWLTLLRKGGHLLGYALLALALQRGLRLKGWKVNFLILGCVLLYALSDEFHQSFVSGRTASQIDVGIDLLGALIGIWVGRIVHGVWASILPIKRLPLRKNKN